MSSRRHRHILEDSDSDGDDRPLDSSFFTAEEEQAIEKCQIRINDNQGKYSEELLAQAIASLGEPPLEDCGGKQLHQKYCVKKGEARSFLEQDIYKVHGAGVSNDDYDVSPSEETILLNIEALRLSGSKIVNEMIKNKETGGQVVFWAWWNYALQRVLQLSSDESANNQSLGTYTAVMILRSLFTFIKDDLKVAIKDKSRVGKLNTNYGIDLLANLKRARKVIDHCGPSHFLDKDLSAVEAHLAGLPDKINKVTEKAASVTSDNAVSPKRTQLDVAEDKKRKAEARKKRTQSMLGSMRRTVDSQSTDAAVSPKKAVTSSHAGARESLSRRDTLQSADPPPLKSSAPMLCSSQRPSPGGADETKPSSERHAHTGDSHDRKSQTKSSAKASFIAPRSDDGWGRRRGEGASAQPFKTKGSWIFARRALSSKIPNSVRREQAGPAGINRAAPRERDARGGGAVPPAHSSADLARDDRGRGRYDPGRDQKGPSYGGRDHEGRDCHVRSDSYSSRPAGQRDSRFEGRSSDRSRDGGARCDQRDHQDSSHTDHHQGGGGLDCSSRDFGHQGYHAQASNQSRSQDRDAEVPPQKRFRGSQHETTGPAGGGGRGRDRTKPAWLTRDKSSDSYGPTGIHGNDNTLASNLGSAVGGMNASLSSVVPLNQPSAVPPRGRGRGRGVKSAWTTGPTGMSIGNHISENATGGDADGAVGRERGARLYRSAGMAQQQLSGNGPSGARLESASVDQNVRTQYAIEALNKLDSKNLSGPVGSHVSTGTTGAVRRQDMENQAPVRSVNPRPPTLMNPPGPVVGGSVANVRGGGQGRGRGRTLPAWMTNSNP